MKATVKTSLAFIVLLFAGGMLIFNRYEQLRNDHLKTCTISQKAAIDSTVNAYRLLADTTFSEILNTKEILELVNNINDSNGEQRDIYRGLLYRRLAPLYDRLRKKNVRQLHFHFPDGRSMLRMHAPARCGDSLFEVRPSIEIANTELREVHGFETGRIFHGFRHVYPLLLNRAHIGSIEISTSFFQIRDELEHLEDTNRATLNFILYKAEMWHKLFPDLHLYYQPSVLHPDYVEEMAELISNHCKDQTCNLSLIAEIKDKLIQDPAVHARLNQKQSCSFSLSYNYATYSIVFHSIKNINNEHAAYIVAIAPAPFIGEIRQNAMQMFLAYTALLTAVSILSFRFAALQAKQQQHADFLQNISDDMGIGLYTTNKKGNVTFINPAALKMLGYSRNELLGHHAHNMFHSAGSDGCRECFCEEVLNRKTRLHTDKSIFRKNSSARIPVEVVCTPLYNQKNIVGTTTVFQDISTRLEQELQLKEAQKQLQKMALQDGLTGIANRRSFDQRARDIWRSALRYKQPLGMLMIDIDHFKLYNDRFGHQKGDQCLVSVAKVMELACKRPEDFVARYGGEEFVALLPNTSVENCCHVARRMLSMLKELNMPHPSSPTTAHVTVSIGCCSMVPNAETRLEDLVSCTDAQLYRAKESGRNTFSMRQPGTRLPDEA